MHQSFFSYNLTRPVPYKWYTWAVGIGGVAAIVFFSFLNLAANGYALEVIYTTDPNTTLAGTQWFQKPFWTLFAKVEASCQSQGLALNTQLFTTQLGLTYKMANVWSYGANGSVKISPSLTYLNNTLENCTVNNIYIDATNTNSVGNSPFWNWQRTIISAVATCSVQNGDLRSLFNMTVEYVADPTTISAYNDGANGVALTSTGFLHLDKYGKACNWWGEQLLHMWYYNVLNVLGPGGYSANDNATASTTLSTLRLSLAPNESKDITSYDFFDITGWFNMADGVLNSFQGSGSVPMQQVLGGYDVGFQLHHFATAFYSTILSDLGQAKGPNILTDRDQIHQYVLAGFDLSPLKGYAASQGQQAFDDAMSTTGDLAIKPSTFNAQYICQVPRRRNAGSVFISVLVADMVFLQTLYKLLMWTTTWWMKRQDHKANYCEGCKKQLPGSSAQAESVALLPMPSNDRDGAKSISAISVSSPPSTLAGRSESVFGWDPLLSPLGHRERI
ncbi:hypothetical protein H2200_005157 [Cladophialophora chaetospira]|uniref:Uncharacterized protein n=1 Tax=Cladophialophora chaetospira TaxID=386627 RepID=A0AA39CJD1_9EURO|nr:hypothetical protein H2200_005157 [Cladophialophora chaetospira]